MGADAVGSAAGLAGMAAGLTPVGAAIGAASSLYSIFRGISQQSQANAIKPNFRQYTANPYAQEQLGVAKNMYGGRMAGAQNAENNIAAGQSNFNASAERNAMDGSQAIALAAAGQGNANNAYANLAAQEGQNKVALLGNLNNAYATNINEGDKEYQSMFSKYQIDMQRKAALSGAGSQNIYNGGQGLGATLINAGGLNKPKT